MAKKKATSGGVMAVALCDIHAYGVRAGQIVEGDQSVIAALVLDGSADTAEAALAYAAEQGASTVQIAPQASQS